MVSRTVSQRELRDDAAGVLRDVQMGETMIVTRNGTPLSFGPFRPASSFRGRSSPKPLYARRESMPPASASMSTLSSTTRLMAEPTRGLLDTSVVIDHDTDAFAPAGAECFRQGRHESEYFDPARPVDKTAADVRWAVELAGRAIAAVEPAISTG